MCHHCQKSTLTRADYEAARRMLKNAIRMWNAGRMHDYRLMNEMFAERWGDKAARMISCAAEGRCSLGYYWTATKRGMRFSAIKHAAWMAGVDKILGKKRGAAA